MKSIHIFIGLILIICASLLFTYQRSFVTQNFEVIDSEEGLYEESEESPKEQGEPGMESEYSEVTE